MRTVNDRRIEADQPQKIDGIAGCSPAFTDTVIKIHFVLAHRFGEMEQRIGRSKQITELNIMGGGKTKHSAAG